MITQVVFWVIICTLGYCIGRIAIGLDAKYAYCMSFPLGIGFSAFVTMILAISNIGLSPRYSLLIIGIVICAIYLVRLKSTYSKRKGPLNLKSSVNFLIFLAVVIVASAVLSGYNYAIYTSDSFSFYEGFGRVIALSKRFDVQDPYMRGQLARVPMVALIHALGFDFRINHLYMFYPLCSLFLIASTVVFSTDFLRRGKYHGNWVLILLSFCVVLLMVNRNFIIHTFAVLSNLVGSLFLSNGLFCYYKCFFDGTSSRVSSNRKDLVIWPFLVCSGAMFGFSTMTRAELCFFTLIPFFFIASNLSAVLRFSILYVPLSYAWLAFRFISLGSKGAYGRGLEIDVLFAAIYIIIFACGMFKGIFVWLRKSGSFIMLYFAFSLVAVFLFLYFRSFFLGSITGLTALMFRTGNWGLFWYLVIPLCCVALLLDDFESKNMFIILVFGFVFLEITIYSVFFGGIIIGNWMRSENRMLLHIIPFLVFYIVHSFSKGLSRNMGITDC